MAPKIYTDTNVLRYLGTAFATASLADDLRDKLLLSPLSVMELLSQLGTNGAAESFAAVQAFPRIHNPKASGMLPWSDDAFRIFVFGLPPGKDVMTPALNNAVVRVLNSAKPEDLEADGKEMRALLDGEKNQETERFSDVLDTFRADGALPEEEHKTIFARAIARQAGVDETTVDVNFVVDKLNAFYVFESTRMKTGAENAKYNVNKRSNDVYDAELLIYLADPTLHLLTSDKGFRRAEKSSQFNRVHIVGPDCLKDPACADSIIRGIVG